MPHASDDLVPLGRPPTEADITAYLEAGNKVDAVKVYQLVHGVDVHTAKQAIDQRWRFMPLTKRDRLTFAAVLGLISGSLVFLNNPDHPLRGIILGVLGVLAWGCQFSVTTSDERFAERRGLLSSPEGPDASSPSSASASQRKRDGAA